MVINSILNAIFCILSIFITPLSYSDSLALSLYPITFSPRAVSSSSVRSAANFSSAFLLIPVNLSRLLLFPQYPLTSCEEQQLSYIWSDNSKGARSKILFFVWRDSGLSLKCRISRLPDQPCWLHALIALQQHSPLTRKFNPSEDWLSLRCLTSVIERALVFPYWPQPSDQRDMQSIFLVNKYKWLIFFICIKFTDFIYLLKSPCPSLPSKLFRLCPDLLCNW